MRELAVSEVENVCGGNRALIEGAKWLYRVVRDGLTYEAAKAGASEAADVAGLGPGSGDGHHAPCPGMCHPSP